jgi:hypothetical protein
VPVSSDCSHVPGGVGDGVAAPGLQSPKADDAASPRQRSSYRAMSYQTIRLRKGRHASPAEGACVMELASMLAGEPFSDHPSSVCPVIGSFLRAYNDRLDDDRRQDLYRCAADVVGSNASERIQRARADRLRAWSEEAWERRRPRRFMPSAWRLIGVVREPPVDVVGIHAVRALGRLTDEIHAAALALIDELLCIGAGDDGSSPIDGDRSPGGRDIGSSGTVNSRSSSKVPVDVKLR